MHILLITTLIALLSLSGALLLRERVIALYLHRYVVPFAIGAFLAVVFLELIPETLAEHTRGGSLAIIGGFLFFYLLAHVLRTFHHHHHGDEHHDHCEASRTSAILLLYGDAIHNIVDGVVIASAFLLDPALGYATAFAVALHEVPQEIAEYGVLRSAGFSRARACLLNLLSASTVIVGALATIILAEEIEGSIWILSGLAAGNLLYVAMTDLVPDVRAHAHETGTFFRSFAATLFGVVLVGGLLVWSHDRFGHEHDHHHEDEIHPEVEHVMEV